MVGVYKQANSNLYISSDSNDYQKLKFELEKQKLIVEQQAKEIKYLKELNDLLK